MHIKWISTQGNDDLVVKLKEPSGKILGHEMNSSNSKLYYAFENIPYAAPPIGQHRFKVRPKL